MFSALIKHQFPRTSALQVARLSRASIHAKAQPNIKTREEFYVTTTFPDDFETSPLKPDDLLKKDKSMGKDDPVVFGKPSIKTREEFYVTSTFPDDFETSPLKLDDSLKMDKPMENDGPVVSDKVTTERHMAAIWDSLNPKEPRVAMKREKVLKEAVREPELDEL